MAVKIQGTDVIGSLHDLKNITNTQGEYTYIDRGTNVQSSAPSAGASVSIDLGDSSSITWDYMTSTALVGTVTWTFPQTVEPGKVVTMFVDASSSGHDQAFSWTNGGTIRYPADTEPDWTLARYWMHQITVWNSSEISIVSTSWAS